MYVSHMSFESCVQHPAAKVIVFAAQQQESEVTFFEKMSLNFY